MGQRCTVTKIQKVLLNLEEFTGQGGSGVTVGLLRTCRISSSEVIEFGDLVEGSLESLKVSEVIEGSERSFEGLRGGILWFAGSVILSWTPEGLGSFLWSLWMGQWKREEGSGVWVWHLRGTEWGRVPGATPVCLSQCPPHSLPPGSDGACPARGREVRVPAAALTHVRVPGEFLAQAAAAA